MPLPMPHDLPAAELVDSAKWLVHALLTEHLGAMHPSLPEWAKHGEALPGGSQSPSWLHACPEKIPERLADWHARDTDRNPNVWHAKLVLATTGLHLAQFRHKHRPLAKAVDYADIFIYNEAQQEAALSDLAILRALPRKCLILRLGDPKQTSGGTGPSDLAGKVRLISDQLALGIVPSAGRICHRCFPSYSNRFCWMTCHQVSCLL